MKFKQLIPQSIHELGQRDNQEDSMYPAYHSAKQDDRLFIICDGMGGHENGEVASNAVCTAMADYVKNNTNPDEPFTDEQFQEALRQGFEALDNAKVGGAKAPGTTLTFVYFHKGGVTVAHIGDSRIYHIRPATKEILYRTRDHSVVFDLYLAGEINEEDLLTHPQKNVITRAMLKGQEEKPKADIVHISNIKLGDYIYLCTDGMLEQMTDQQLLDIICDSELTDPEKRDILVNETKQNRDNHTAYLIKVGPIESEFGDENLVDDEEKAMSLIRKRQAMVIAEDVTFLDEEPNGMENNEQAPVPAQASDDVAPVQPAPQVPPQTTPQAAPQAFQQAEPQPQNAQSAVPPVAGAPVAGMGAAPVANGHPVGDGAHRTKPSYNKNASGKRIPWVPIVVSVLAVAAIAALAILTLGPKKSQPAPAEVIPQMQHTETHSSAVRGESSNSSSSNVNHSESSSRQVTTPEPSRPTQTTTTAPARPSTQAPSRTTPTTTRPTTTTTPRPNTTTPAATPRQGGTNPSSTGSTTSQMGNRSTGAPTGGSDAGGGNGNGGGKQDPKKDGDGNRGNVK